MASGFSKKRVSEKQGFLNKKGGIIKSWSRRYFMLNKQSLVYFRREQEFNSESPQSGLSPLGRIFLTDVVNIEAESVRKKEPFVFSLHTKKRSILLQASSAAECDSWVSAIREALQREGKAENEDPFRRTLRRLAPGLKRVTLAKDPQKGIGCTIKSAAGHIFVNRITEDGPIAYTGVLRPDDELLDVNGITLTGMSVSEVGKVIHDCPEEFLATVRPITALKKLQPPDVIRISYVTVLPNLAGSCSHQDKDGAFTTRESELSNVSLDDVGDYDDDGTNGSLPPLPSWTRDAMILIPSPLGGENADRPSTEDTLGEHREISQTEDTG